MIYKFTIAPKGALGTPLRSDTLFGHACWTIRMNESEERFKEFLDAATMQSPELVFSDGFPSDWFPRPLLPKRIPELSTKDEKIKFKNASKRKWVCRKFAENCKWDLKILAEQASVVPEGYSDSPHEEAVLRNIIDRMTGTSLNKNGMYSQNQLWFEAFWKNVDIFVSTDWSKDKLTDFIDSLFSIGYGRDQTVGLGNIEIVKKPEIETFPNAVPGWYLSLSRAAPSPSVNLHESFFQIEPKYGKVWNGLEQQKSPFKKVIMQTIPGSVFKVNSATERDGRVLTNIHDNGHVIENCMTILYPLPESAIQGACQ